MRIAPIAFFVSSDDPSFHETVRDVCRITHRHDEAYVGALAVAEYVSLSLQDVPAEQILTELPQRLPDTVVRDRLIEADSMRHEAIGAIRGTFRLFWLRGGLSAARDLRRLQNPPAWFRTGD
ncbi:MAG: ADP-ribosylglycohydrolase family protein [Opitutaceae bacterium]|nr:ADP-ribosylglycohydrolase family protein [Opitutaceae bacterium]